jgi:hypothetical protein
MADLRMKVRMKEWKTIASAQGNIKRWEVKPGFEFDAYSGVAGKNPHPSPLPDYKERGE